MVIFTIWQVNIIKQSNYCHFSCLTQSLDISTQRHIIQKADLQHWQNTHFCADITQSLILCHKRALSLAVCVCVASLLQLEWQNGWHWFSTVLKYNNGMWDSTFICSSSLRIMMFYDCLFDNKSITINRHLYVQRTHKDECRLQRVSSNNVYMYLDYNQIQLCNNNNVRSNLKII